MDLDVRSRPDDGDDGAAVLDVTGSIDAASRARLSDAASRAIDAGARTLVVDLSGVRFIDSTGIGTLVDLAGAADEAGGKLVVRDPSRPVVRILEVAGLADQWVERS